MLETNNTTQPATTQDPIMDNTLASLLVCPVTKGPLRWDHSKHELISTSARLAYPLREGIPVLLETEARTLSDEELASWATKP